MGMPKISQISGLSQQLTEIQQNIVNVNNDALPKTGGDISGVVTVPTPTDSSATSQIANVEYVNTKCNNVKLSMATLNITLLANSWNDKKYTISNEQIKLEQIIILGVNSNITLNAYNELGDAKIISFSQSNGILILKALGDIPTNDIDITLTLIN